jgi:hypothetical protein
MSMLGTPLLFLLLLAAEGQPVPKSPVGKETTYITGPLDKEGYLDYQAALNERLGKGVTPEKNANVLLWKAFGPMPEGGKGMPAEYFLLLSMEEPPKDGAYFIGLSAYGKDHLKLNASALDQITDQQSRAVQRSWTAKDYPHLAAWLKANEKPLALVVAATRCPDYFNPLISPRNENEPGSLINASLPSLQPCRELVNALAARAMLRVGSGRFEEAWQDLLACHRLGRLVARGATLIESLVGGAIDSVASNADLAYLDRVPGTSKQIQECLKDLQSLPSLPPPAAKIDLCERFMYLETLQLIRRGGFGVLEGLAGRKAEKPDALLLMVLAKLDWEPALRNGNSWYDRLVAALRLKDRASRETELIKIEEELKALKTQVGGPANLAKLFLLKDPPEKTISKAISDILIGLLMPAARKMQTAHDRIEQVQRNVQVAFALAAYHRDQKHYPAKLDDLAPQYQAAIPNDLFSGNVLVYRASANGYLLYSVGVNGQDEGGRSADDDPAGDDLPVRMPLPELKPKK